MTEALRINTSRRAPYLLISLVVLAAHGLLLANTGVFWDDWLVKGFLDDGNWHLLRNMASEMGLPILAYFFGAVKLAGFSDHFKVLAFAIILSIALVVYEIGVRSRCITKSEALLIATISAVYPAFQTAVLLTTLQYLFFYLVFLCAVLLVQHAQAEACKGLRKTAVQVVAALLFFLSFNLNSLLVFYFPIQVLILLNLLDRSGLGWKNYAAAVGGMAHFVVLPFLYWGIKKTFFPTYGLYEKYNALDLNFQVVAARIGYSLEVGSLYHWKQAAAQLALHPLLWVVVLAAACALHVRRERKRKHRSPGQETERHGGTVYVFMFGLVLLVCAAFPYAVAGIVPGTNGWNTRHTLLYGLPIAIILVAAIRVLPGLLRVLLATTCILAFILYSVSYYVDWQARAIKDQAIVDHLRTHQHLQPYSIYWVTDEFQAGGELYYNYYEWSSMFKKAWGGQSRIAMQLHYMGRPIQHELPPSLVFTNRYNLQDFDPKGRQACLKVTPGYPGLSAQKLVTRYFRLRLQELSGLEQDSRRSSDFVRGAVRISAKALTEEASKLPPITACADLPEQGAAAQYRHHASNEGSSGRLARSSLFFTA